MSEGNGVGIAEPSRDRGQRSPRLDVQRGERMAHDVRRDPWEASRSHQSLPGALTVPAQAAFAVADIRAHHERLPDPVAGEERGESIAIVNQAPLLVFRLKVRRLRQLNQPGSLEPCGHRLNDLSDSQPQKESCHEDESQIFAVATLYQVIALFSGAECDGLSPLYCRDLHSLKGASENFALGSEPGTETLEPAHLTNDGVGLQPLFIEVESEVLNVGSGKFSNQDVAGPARKSLQEALGVLKRAASHFLKRTLLSNVALDRMREAIGIRVERKSLPQLRCQPDGFVQVFRAERDGLRANAMHHRWLKVEELPFLVEALNLHGFRVAGQGSKWQGCFWNLLGNDSKTKVSSMPSPEGQRHHRYLCPSGRVANSGSKQGSRPASGSDRRGHGHGQPLRNWLGVESASSGFIRPPFSQSFGGLPLAQISTGGEV